jgi:hypothetical protein
MAPTNELKRVEFASISRPEALHAALGLAVLVVICAGLHLLFQLAGNYRVALRLARAKARAKAAVQVQKFSRLRLAYLLLRTNREAATTVQSWVRMKEPHLLLRASRDAATRLQGLARMHMANLLLRNCREAATTVQREARRMLATASLLVALRAAVTIQSYARMRGPQLHLHASCDAAITLQKEARWAEDTQACPRGRAPNIPFQFELTPRIRPHSGEWSQPPPSWPLSVLLRACRARCAAGAWRASRPLPLTRVRCSSAISLLNPLRSAVGCR